MAHYRTKYQIIDCALDAGAYDGDHGLMQRMRLSEVAAQRPSKLMDILKGRLRLPS
jgi:hypothetical protein